MKVARGSWWAWTAPRRRTRPSAGRLAWPSSRSASLQVITCWESPTTYVWAIPPAFDSGDDAKRTLEETVAEVLGDDPGIDIDLTVVEGQAAPVLLDAAPGSVAPRGGQPEPSGS